MGGTLQSLTPTKNRSSLLDKVIFDNFQSHL